MESQREKVGFKELMAFRKDVTSQTGENGIIQSVCDVIGCDRLTCIEFGAWDGVHLSNVYPLWHDLGWSALLIEGNPGKAEALRANSGDRKVAGMCAFVDESGNNSLPLLAERAGFASSWDVLSIDVDGNDYAILESVDLSRHGVRVVVVEYNNSMPPHFHYVSRGKNYTGSSALAFVRMMKNKGYELLCCCGTNLFFVSRKDFDGHFGYDNDLDKIFDYSNVSCLMSDYAGNLMCDKLPNHTPAERGIFPAVRRAARWLKHPQTRRDPRNGPCVRGVQIAKETSGEAQTRV